MLHAIALPIFFVLRPAGAVRVLEQPGITNNEPKSGIRAENRLDRLTRFACHFEYVYEYRPLRGLNTSMGAWIDKSALV